MNRDFAETNNSLSEELFEYCKLQFSNENPSLLPLPLTSLPLFLENLKLSIPETMMKDYKKCILESKEPKMTFKQFTHYVARAGLEVEVEEELRNLFYMIDKEESGVIDAQDLWRFIKELDGGDLWLQRDVDGLMKELDGKDMGFLGYEEFIYGLLPK